MFIYVCMYVCMHVCMYVYVSQGDFRLMSFTAGRCGTPLIVCVSKSVSPSRPSGSKADRDEPRSEDERSESAGVGPKGLYEPNRTDRSVLL